MKKIGTISRTPSSKNPYIDEFRTYNKKEPEYQVYVQGLFDTPDVRPLNVSKISEVYIVNLDRPRLLNKTPIQPGKYIVKIYYDQHRLRQDSINYLKQLSFVKLIPSLIYIDDEIYVQKYISNATDLAKVMTEDIDRKRGHQVALYKYIWTELEKLVEKWHKYGFSHRDISPRNILIDTKGNVYLIDPKEEHWGRNGFKKDNEDMDNMKLYLRIS